MPKKSKVDNTEVLEQIKHLEGVVSTGKAQTRDVTLIYKLARLFKYRGEPLFMAPDAHKRILNFLNEIKEKVK